STHTRALRAPRFPYATLFRSTQSRAGTGHGCARHHAGHQPDVRTLLCLLYGGRIAAAGGISHYMMFSGEMLNYPVEQAHLMIVRSEEHTSELQSRENLVCRLL